MIDISILYSEDTNWDEERAYDMINFLNSLKSLRDLDLIPYEDENSGFYMVYNVSNEGAGLRLDYPKKYKVRGVRSYIAALKKEMRKRTKKTKN